jgi:sortase B
MSKNAKKTGWKILFIVSVLVFIGCAGYYGFTMYQDHQAKKHRQEVLEAMESTEFTGEMEGEEPDIPKGIRHGEDVDFEKLQKINQDLYAWIYIPHTKVDYPIAQSPDDNRYYLKYNMNKEPEFAGCIYTENYNKKDFTDPNTVIYGHNMRNDSMFGSLHDFEDKKFFDKNKFVFIYTPEKIFTYRIFAAYEYDDRHILGTFDFEKKEVYKKYLESIYDVNTMVSNYRKDVKVDEEDKIITLSTCAGGKPEFRYLVQAVLEDVKTR